VDSVVKYGAAEKAGLQQGDIIKKIGRTSIEDREDIRTAIGSLKPYMKTKMVIERGGEDKTLDVVVGARSR
jgi:S1-C subfamily serine protease